MFQTWSPSCFYRRSGARCSRAPFRFTPVISAVRRKVTEKNAAGQNKFQSLTGAVSDAIIDGDKKARPSIPGQKQKKRRVRVPWAA